MTACRPVSRQCKLADNFVFAGYLSTPNLEWSFTTHYHRCCNNGGLSFADARALITPHRLAASVPGFARTHLALAAPFLCHMPHPACDAPQKAHHGYASRQQAQGRRRPPPTLTPDDWEPTGPTPAAQGTSKTPPRTLSARPWYPAQPPSIPTPADLIHPSGLSANTPLSIAAHRDTAKPCSG